MSLFDCPFETIKQAISHIAIVYHVQYQVPFVCRGLTVLTANELVTAEHDSQNIGI